MKVTFADFGPSLASSRLRASIPQRELEKLGIARGNDVLIYGKHWVTEEQIKPFKKRVFDVCDNHFDNEHGSYYRQHVEAADLVTCNSEVMRRIIEEKTGRQAVVIKEPYESTEHLPSIGPMCLWFGHRSNLPDLIKLHPLPYPLLALTNHPDYPEWNPESFRQAMNEPCIVVIPTGKSMAKSENRMVESIRCGKYVCADYLPSYEPFYEFFPQIEIKQHLEIALNDEAKSLERIRAAQDYIRETYSPKAIGKHWLKVINEHINLR